MPEIDVLIGGVRRLCTECGVEVGVQSATRGIGCRPSKKWRRVVHQEPGRRVPAEAGAAWPAAFSSIPGEPDAC
jgi:hypothetical protein